MDAKIVNSPALFPGYFETITKLLDREDLLTIPFLQDLRKYVADFYDIPLEKNWKEYEFSIATPSEEVSISLCCPFLAVDSIKRIGVINSLNQIGEGELQPGWQAHCFIDGHGNLCFLDGAHVALSVLFRAAAAAMAVNKAESDPEQSPVEISNSLVDMVHKFPVLLYRDVDTLGKAIAVNQGSTVRRDMKLPVFGMSLKAAYSGLKAAVASEKDIPKEEVKDKMIETFLDEHSRLGDKLSRTTLKRLKTVHDKICDAALRVADVHAEDVLAGRVSKRGLESPAKGAYLLNSVTCLVETTCIHLREAPLDGRSLTVGNNMNMQIDAFVLATQAALRKKPDINNKRLLYNKVAVLTLELTFHQELQGAHGSPLPEKVVESPTYKRFIYKIRRTDELDAVAVEAFEEAVKRNRSGITALASCDEVAQAMEGIEADLGEEEAQEHAQAAAEEKRQVEEAKKAAEEAQKAHKLLQEQQAENARKEAERVREREEDERTAKVRERGRLIAEWEEEQKTSNVSFVRDLLGGGPEGTPIPEVRRLVTAEVLDDVKEKQVQLGLDPHTILINNGSTMQLQVPSAAVTARNQLTRVDEGTATKFAETVANISAAKSLVIWIVLSEHTKSHPDVGLPIAALQKAKVNARVGHTFFPILGKEKAGHAAMGALVIGFGRPDPSTLLNPHEKAQDEEEKREEEGEGEEKEGGEGSEVDQDITDLQTIVTGEDEGGCEDVRKGRGRRKKIHSHYDDIVFPPLCMEAQSWGALMPVKERI